MRRPLQIGLLVLGVGAATTSVAGLFFEEGPSRVIYPDQQLPLHFDHALHTRKADKEKKIEGAGVSCTFCHEDIDESKSSSDRNIPGHDVCENCHADWIGEEDEPAPLEACNKCHAGPPLTKTSSAVQKLVLPAPHLKFSHQRHIEGAELECESCHANVRQKKLATRNDLPTMDRCIACHQDSKASTNCDTCHLKDKEGRIEDHFASGRLMPRRFHQFALHDGQFLKDHSNAARSQPQYCSNCHAKTECLTCHDGIGRDLRFHPGDWIAIHSLQSRKDSVRCQSCHVQQNFCLNCHVRSGVATVTDPASFNNIRRGIRRRDGQGDLRFAPHPMAADGWNNNASPNFHGFQAQRNIRACASCHQEQFCITCHATTEAGVGGENRNPHGANTERLRNSTASKRNARACLKCHSPNDPTWR